jgi:hypothetical protein
VPVPVPAAEGAEVPFAGVVPAVVGDDVLEVEPAALGSVGVAGAVPFELDVDGGDTVTGDVAGPTGPVRFVGVPGPYSVLS